MGSVVYVQNPSSCFCMSTLGPLQKLSFTLLASGALMRSCTRPAESTRGYCAFITLLSAGLKSPGSCAPHTPAIRKAKHRILFMEAPRERMDQETRLPRGE